jgi:hypothetical protein
MRTWTRLMICVALAALMTLTAGHGSGQPLTGASAAPRAQVLHSNAAGHRDAGG